MFRFASLLLLALLPSVTLAQDSIRLDETQIPWAAGPASLPPGAQAAVLEGNPQGEGLFTLRLRLPAGTRLEPHWHPRPERVTVLSGAVGLGFGDSFDPTQLRVFRVGSYYLTPPGLHHYVAVPEDTVLQITTHGPWQLHRVRDTQGDAK